MKTRTTATIILFFLLFSCQSEYQERLEKGKAIERKIQKLQSKKRLTDTDQQVLMELYHSLKLQAKISGNEPVFLEEIR